MTENHPVLKKLLILSIAIVFIFSAFNLAWYIGVKRTYNHIAEDLDKVADEETKGVHYRKEIDGYTYLLSMTAYLLNSGFFSIEKSDGYVVELDSDGNAISDNGVHVSLFIWPKTFGGYEYGVDIYSEIEGIWEQIHINCEGDYIPENDGNLELNEYLSSVIDNYHDEIVTMLNLAKKYTK